MGTYFRYSRIFDTLGEGRRYHLYKQVVYKRDDYSQFIPVASITRVQVYTRYTGLLRLNRHETTFQGPPRFGIRLRTRCSRARRMGRRVSKVVPHFGSRLRHFRFRLRSDRPSRTGLVDVHRRTVTTHSALVLLFHRIRTLLEGVHTLPHLRNVSRSYLQTRVYRGVRRTKILCLRRGVVPLRRLPALSLGELLGPTPSPIPSRSTSGSATTSKPSSCVPGFFDALLSPGRRSSRSVPGPTGVPTLRRGISILGRRGVRLRNFLTATIRERGFSSIQTVQADLRRIGQRVRTVSEVFEGLGLWSRRNRVKSEWAFLLCILNIWL